VTQTLQMMSVVPIHTSGNISAFQPDLGVVTGNIPSDTVALNNTANRMLWPMAEQARTTRHMLYKS
jgi:hypothetical protein